MFFLRRSLQSHDTSTMQLRTMVRLTALFVSISLISAASAAPGSPDFTSQSNATLLERRQSTIPDCNEPIYCAPKGERYDNGEDCNANCFAQESGSGAICRAGIKGM